MNKTKSPCSGFTLIELLTVIAIIGILASIIIPTVGAVKTKANMVTSASNLRQVALAHTNFATGGTRTRKISQGTWVAGGNTASTVAEWAQVLADLGGLNDGALYFVSSASDVAELATIPKTILKENAAGTAKEPAEDWIPANTGAISYDMAVGVSPNAQTTITALIWTKGLTTGGTWPTSSPWEGEGGHIGFVDGHVAFYETVVDELVDYSTKAKSSDIEQAIGGGTVLEATPVTTP